MHLDGSLQLSLGQASYAGLKESNEDSIGMSMPDGQALVTKGAVAMLADGISVGDTGKEASNTCVTSFLSDYYSTPDSWTVQKSALQVLYALNRWLWGQGQAYVHAEHGYVCALCVAIFKSHTAHIFHVGDSRVYRLRDGTLELLTRDHAAKSDVHHVDLSRAMGLHSRVDIEYQAVEMDEGDVFFLSTGGLHDYLDSKAIENRLLNLDEGGAEQACSDLIAQALEGQSNENLSCQVVRIDALPDESLNAFSGKLTELPFPPELAVGDEIDGFVVESQILASNRSRLYVVATSAGERFVMKAPLVKFNDDPRYVERFLMESWIGARVNSPYVLKSASVARRKQYLYHITEYVDGMSLKQWLATNTNIDIAERMAMIEQICKGLAALHRNDIVHRDLTPDNIMVSGSGQIKIIDLGSCLVGSVDEIAAPAERDELLDYSGYAAPELKQNKVAGSQADQFSLAAIVFEMLANEKPFEGDLGGAVANSEYARLNYVSASDINPQIPIWRDAAIRKALSTNAKLRYADVYEFLYDLNHANSNFSNSAYVPLIERYPVGFWQSVAGVSLLANAVLMYSLYGG